MCHCRLDQACHADIFIDAVEATPDSGGLPAGTAPAASRGGDGGGQGLHARTALASGEGGDGGDQALSPQTAPATSGGGEGDGGRVVLEMGFGAGGYAGSPPAGAGAE